MTPNKVAPPNSRPPLRFPSSPACLTLDSVRTSCSAAVGELFRSAKVMITHQTQETRDAGRGKTILLACILFMETGCVSYHKRPASWPEPLVANEARQLEGTYSNFSIDPKTNELDEQRARLFDFISGRGRAYGKDGGRKVELRASPDGSTLHIRLIESKWWEVDSAMLKRGSQFDFVNGALELYDSSGWAGEAGSMGTQLKRSTARIYLASNGNLLGRSSEGGGGLLFFFIPVVNAEKDWMMWPKIPEE